MKPAPLTPPHCDLRDFSWMPLDVVRLRDSDLTVLASGDAFRAACLLWCASWHQVPAASLPTDDRLLANLAGYGRDMKGWSDVRDDALRGFVECSDGRLYHPVVAEKALEANDQRKAQKERTRKATDARRGGKRDGDHNDERHGQNKSPSDRVDHRNGHRDDARNEVQQTGQDQTRPEQTEPSPKSGIQRPVVVVVPETTTTTEATNASQGKARGLSASFSLLPVDWVPDAAILAKVEADFGMTIDDAKQELPAFHALNVQKGTLSHDWSATFYLFAKQWKVRQGRATPARVQLSKTPATPHEPTESEWDFTVKTYAKTGRWSHQFGPDPMSGKCRCPIAILVKNGINAETGERAISPGKEAVAS
jgi:hypothetical protein